MDHYPLIDPYYIGTPLRICPQGQLNSPNAIQWPDAFSPELKTTLYQIGSINILHKGQSLPDHMSQQGGLCIAISGALKHQFTDAEGSTTILGFYLHGDTLHIDPLSTPDIRHEVKCIVSSQIYHIPMQVLRQYIPNFPDLLDYYIATTHSALQDASRRIMITNNLHADQKVAYFLLNMSARLRHQKYAWQRFVLSMSRTEIAQHLVLTAETISRALTRFQECEYISVSRREVSILNTQGLLQVLNADASTAPPIKSHPLMIGPGSSTHRFV